MNSVKIVGAYLDRKPMGSDPLANALRARGQRITDNMCMLENVLYWRTENGLRAQYITESRSIAAVSGVPAELASNIWYDFDNSIIINVCLNEIVVPNHDFLIKIIESDYCIYKLDNDKIYISAISNGACERIETAVRANGFTAVYNKIAEPIYTGSVERYPGLVWALESTMALQSLNYSRGLFDGIAASYCALTGAKIIPNYFDKSFILMTSASRIVHKCYRLERGDA
jgi:hypothetical protein